MEESLIICIGNPARGDDGVAHQVARLLASDECEGRVSVLTATMLDVLHAEAVSRARRVIVVDAERRTEPAVRVESVKPGPLSRDTHGIDPSALLGLATALYEEPPPPTWLVSVAAPAMGHETGLSEKATSAAAAAAERIRALLEAPGADRSGRAAGG